MLARPRRLSRPEALFEAECFCCRSRRILTQLPLSLFLEEDGWFLLPIRLALIRPDRSDLTTLDFQSHCDYFAVAAAGPKNKTERNWKLSEGR